MVTQPAADSRLGPRAMLIAHHSFSTCHIKINIFNMILDDPSFILWCLPFKKLSEGILGQDNLI